MEMRKKVPLYILAQAQTCVPIPIPELKPCAQRILQTESSLFSSVLCYQHYPLFSILLLPGPGPNSCPVLVPMVK